MRSTFLHIWKFPFFLALLTGAGLLSALLGTGLWHFLSWFALTVPVAVALRFSFFSRQDRNRQT
jgi:hypothetical protein